MVEVPKMLFLNKYLKFMILPVILTLITGSNTVALEKVKNLLGYTATTSTTPAPALSMAEQFQAALNELLAYMPDDLDLSTLEPAEKTALEAIATKIDLLVKDRDFIFTLHAQYRTTESFMAFRFPALQLTKLGKIATVSEYSTKATLTDTIIHSIPGRAFELDVIKAGWAFIGINNTDFTSLIAENKQQIIAGDQIRARCRLWRNLVNYRYYAQKPSTDLFLIEILNINNLAVIKWYTADTLLSEANLQHVLDMATDLSCNQEIVDFLRGLIAKRTEIKTANEEAINKKVIERVMWVLEAQNKTHRKANSTNLSTEKLIELANKYLRAKVLAEYGHKKEPADVHYHKYSKQLKAEIAAEIARVYGAAQPKTDSLAQSPDADSIGEPSDRSRAASTGTDTGTDRSTSPSSTTVISDDRSDTGSVREPLKEKTVNGKRYVFEPNTYIIGGKAVTGAGGKWVQAL